jgi:hypothetical protein
MSKDDAAWLLVRFVGLLCCVFALLQLVGIGYWVGGVVDAYAEFHERDVPRRIALIEYRSAWLFLIDQLLGILAASLVGWYSLSKGGWLHALIMRGARPPRSAATSTTGQGT